MTADPTMPTDDKPLTPYFRRDGDCFVPLDVCRGYWAHDSLHGRGLVGLIGHEIDRSHRPEGMVPARFHADMHRLARFAPLTIETNTIRSGGRLNLVEAVVKSEGSEVARAQIQYLRPAPAPGGRVWQPEAWDVPAPEDLPLPPPQQALIMFDGRMIRGEMMTFGHRQAWLREIYEPVAGEGITPWTRVAMLADFASPFAHGGENGIDYINTDAVVHLHRLPQGEWLGIEVTGQDASQGIAVGHCRLYDRAGSIGHVSNTALAQARR